MAPKLGGNALAQFNRQKARMKGEITESSIQWKIKMQELFTISWEGEPGGGRSIPGRRVHNQSRA